MRWITLGIVGLLLAGAPEASMAAPKLSGLIGDHAVVQRGRPIAIAGEATPGETVTVVLHGSVGSARAGRDGRFRVTLPALPAGGPYDLLVTGSGGSTILHDILVGDVFLCSGQSNMELAVDHAQDFSSLAASPGDDQLRLVTVSKVAALTPRVAFDPVPGWATAGPRTTPSFSAACFYMAQELRKMSGVPIGAIHSSWGGSQISAWMGEDAQRASGRAREADLLALYARDPAAANRAASATWEAWWRAQTGDAPGREPWQPDAALAWQPVPKVSYYGEWSGKLASFLGLLWYQNSVTLSAAQARQPAAIALGPVDDADRTWINGKPIGASGNGAPRVYTVPVGTLKAGRNVITVSVVNSYGQGGMPGPADIMKLTFADGSEVPMGSGWRYALVEKPVGTTPHVPWDDINGAGTLYNAMIAPLGPVALAGVAWYQGESDTGLPGYDARLKAMMAGWRRQFGVPDLPFAIASLSGYGTPATAPAESGWAALRDVQRRVAEADGHAAVAITLDLGDPLDIHPGEKREVGRRLARALAALAYRAPVSPSGPRVATARRAADGGVTLSFADVGRRAPHPQRGTGDRLRTLWRGSGLVPLRARARERPRGRHRGRRPTGNARALRLGRLPGRQPVRRVSVARGPLRNRGALNAPAAAPINAAPP